MKIVAIRTAKFEGVVNKAERGVRKADFNLERLLHGLRRCCFVQEVLARTYWRHQLNNHIEFSVPGIPRGQGRPKFARIGKGVRAYKAKDDVNTEGNIAFWFMQAAGAGHVPWEGAVSVEIRAYFPVPKSRTKKWKAENEEQRKPYLSRPDEDNISKVVKDALNGITWQDDALVFRCLTEKWYSKANEQPRVVVDMWHVVDGE